MSHTAITGWQGLRLDIVKRTIFPRGGGGGGGGGVVAFYHCLSIPMYSSHVTTRAACCITGMHVDVLDHVFLERLSKTVLLKSYSSSFYSHNFIILHKHIPRVCAN